MESMFYCSSLTNLNLSNFNNVTDMRDMFNGFNNLYNNSIIVNDKEILKEILKELNNKQIIIIH